MRDIVRLKESSFDILSGKCEVCGRSIRRKHRDGWVDVDPNGVIVNCSNAKVKRQ
jgi:hypothetical protein